MQVIIPDLSATTDVDPCFVRLVADLEAFRAHPAIDGDEGAKEAAIAWQAAQLSEYESSTEPKPSISIGYIPPSKLTAIDNMKFAAVSHSRKVADDKAVDATEAALNAVSESLRETVRWGVKGCVIPGVEFEQVNATWRGQTHKVCAERIVDMFEANGWLHALTNEILRFNRLGDSKKKK